MKVKDLNEANNHKLSLILFNNIFLSGGDFVKLVGKSGKVWGAVLFSIKSILLKRHYNLQIKLLTL